MSRRRKRPCLFFPIAEVFPRATCRRVARFFSRPNQAPIPTCILSAKTAFPQAVISFFAGPISLPKAAGNFLKLPSNSQPRSSSSAKNKSPFLNPPQDAMRSAVRRNSAFFSPLKSALSCFPKCTFHANIFPLSHLHYAMTLHFFHPENFNPPLAPLRKIRETLAKMPSTRRTPLTRSKHNLPRLLTSFYLIKWPQDSFLPMRTSLCTVRATSCAPSTKMQNRSTWHCASRHMSVPRCIFCTLWKNINSSPHSRSVSPPSLLSNTKTDHPLYHSRLTLPNKNQLSPFASLP